MAGAGGILDWRKRGHPWLEVFGENGPWLIDRLISARELPDDSDTEGKASHISDAMRRTASADDAVLTVELYGRLCSRTLSWASDGADRSVGLAATETFPNMFSARGMRATQRSHL